MLHTPIADGRRHFCGPTAIAAVTGATFDEVYKKIRRVRSDRNGRVRDTAGRKVPIKGMGNFDLLLTMKRFGFKVKAKGSLGYPTLRALLEDRGHLGPIIVNVTHHYIAVSRGMICDTFTKVPIPMMDYPKLRVRVEGWYQFE